jgi:hypothetical protein
MDRDDLHELISLFKEEFEAGRVVIRSKDTLEDLKRVRLAPDGKIDPATVTSSVRAHALAVAGAVHERAIREMPLREVQEAYFDGLTKHFGTIFDQMQQAGGNPQNVANAIVSKDSLVKAFAEEVQQFAAGLQEFWDDYGPVVEAHLKDLRSMKTVFGGDLFPSYTENIACSVGLYTDTIVLPDPLHRLSTIHAIMEPRELCRLFIKHALNALSYRGLALADLTPPIAVIAPDYLADNAYRESLMVAGEADTLEHCSKLFGRDFNSIRDLQVFLDQFPDLTSMVASMVDPARMLFDVQWTGPLVDQFARYEKDYVSQFGKSQAPSHVLEQMILGRMMATSDVAFRSARFGGSPLIDAPTSWQYLLWSYEYNGNIPRPDSDVRDLLITKSLSLSGSNHGMLSGIPPEALVELRREGALTDIRNTIRSGIDDINSASDATLKSVGVQVISNIDAALSQHDQELHELSSSRKKFFGLDVSRYVVVGGCALASTLVHSSPFNFLLGAPALIGAKRPEELWKEFKEQNATSKTLRRSPTGIMFRHLKKNFGF